ncbi:hypothetical protein [Segniliparus rugosus]|uniref:Uncharacterized protein n=1 Tax=Segniliparus rugosus (strain ATCC BAA-974 / DSM 45345 / CCUG 50838 / CIP 108380 / JCM 13579 / CDC 945) TaxID=679197 RepID=E5XKX3_SEGRC|nr:hypothetical protein [Segniliparus rugosus]EFV14955.2 hypothetical protein HMPREF9336_00142 [Segniliparus rugosus ATCC BAA-974]
MRLGRQGALALGSTKTVEADVNKLRKGVPLLTRAVVGVDRFARWASRPSANESKSMITLLATGYSSWPPS